MCLLQEPQVEPSANELSEEVGELTIDLLIKLVTEMIINHEIKEYREGLVKQMVEYRNNLSRKIASLTEEEEEEPITMQKFLGSFTAGWKE